MVSAPERGADTRKKLGARAGQAMNYVNTHGHEAVEMGRELYERGRHLADEAAEMFDEGRRLMGQAEAQKA